MFESLNALKNLLIFMHENKYLKSNIKSVRLTKVNEKIPKKGTHFCCVWTHIKRENELKKPKNWWFFLEFS